MKFSLFLLAVTLSQSLSSYTLTNRIAEDPLIIASDTQTIDITKIEQTPEVSNDKLFDAIVAPHKGKIVLVDFWNTWCSPCQRAIKAIEPLKSAELKSDNLVWIYIANETSPLETYKNDIAKIHGLHYRLNKQQWDYLCEKFEINGIPSYVLVQKDGRYEQREDFLDHNLIEATLRELIY